MPSLNSPLVKSAIMIFLLCAGSGSLKAETAFSYQGQLINQGVPAEGLHDFSFELYDALVDGNIWASSVIVEDVMVSDGLFTAQIDFGATFDGTRVWMEISVRPGDDTGPYSTLSPRQPITPSPMALEADSLDGMDSDDFATNADLNALLSQIANLQSRLDALASPTVLGPSTQTSSGRFEFGGRTGMAAANAMCEQSFQSDATTHACTLHEIQRAVSEGNVASSASEASAWLVAPVTEGSFFNGMLQNTCQGLMYNSGDIATGTRVTIRLDYTTIGNGGGVTGDAIELQNDIACGNVLPVLCCR